MKIYEKFGLDLGMEDLETEIRFRFEYQISTLAETENTSIIDH